MKNNEYGVFEQSNDPVSSEDVINYMVSSESKRQ